ncbi:MAG: hypothetical protein AAFP97_08965 [Pseudomonadota bacterium]
MSNETLMKDLETATAIARQGQNAPLLGGSIGLMWGVLLTVVLGLQYAILEQIIALPFYSIAFLWIGFGLIGGAGNFILGRKIEQMDGAYSFGNRVEAAVWVMFGAMISTSFVAALIATATGLQDSTIWGLIIVLAFMGQGLAYGATTRIKHSSLVTFSALSCFVAGTASLLVYDTTLVFLIGAIGSFFAIVIPSLFSLKA